MSQLLKENYGSFKEREITLKMKATNQLMIIVEMITQNSVVDICIKINFNNSEMLRLLLLHL